MGMNIRFRGKQTSGKEFAKNPEIGGIACFSHGKRSA
jgi:hypothetical protein